MATYSSNALNNQIIIIVDISIPGLETIPPIRVNSLFDTGAQRTAVSPHLIESLGLKNIGMDFFLTAGGDVIETLKYHVRVEIPIVSDVERRDGTTHLELLSSGKGLTAFGLPYQPSGYDVLLGMDFISHFHITMWNNQFILSN